MGCSYFKYHTRLYMPRYLDYFLLLVVFLAGTGIGVYSGDKISENDIEIDEARIAKSVQDIVIQNIQREQLKKENEQKLNELKINEKPNDEPIVTVSAIEKKLSSDAKLVIKKHFDNCGHSEVKRVDIPYNLINCTEDDIIEQYEGWTLENFDTDEVVISRNFPTNCSEHFLIIEKSGEIALYNELTKDKLNFIEKIDIDIDLLPETENQKFEEGIHLYKLDNVNSFIEDYVS